VTPGAPRSGDPRAVLPYPEHLCALAETFLSELDFAAVQPAGRLVEAMRYSLLAGGKRIRPVLALSTAERLGADPASVLPYAAALELIHTYSLIHDDLPAIDDDQLRRGKATCHVVFGEDIAILAGDGLFAEAFRLIVDEQGGDAAVIVAAVREVARATGVQGMVGGQFMDVAATARGDDELRLLHELKTGRLIEAAVAGAALLCGADDGSLERLRVFAREVGLLFQIVDDILDVVGDTDVLGKSAGQDARHDKTTYVTRFGLDGARALAAESHGRALATLSGLPGPVGALEAVTAYIHTRES
jgi:geranylgeranyl diphosphate synthase, type II